MLITLSRILIKDIATSIDKDKLLDKSLVKNDFFSGLSEFSLGKNKICNYRNAIYINLTEWRLKKQDLE